MLPPQTSTAIFLPAERSLAIDQRSQCRRACAFSQSFFALEQEQDRVGNFFFFHGDDVVHIFLHQRQSTFSRAPHRDAVRDGRGRGERHWLAFRHRRPSSMAAATVCTPITLHLRIGLLHRASDAANQAAAADRDDDGFDVGMLLQHFQADSSLPGDDRVVVEGMNEGQPLCWLRRTASSQASS